MLESVKRQINELNAMSLEELKDQYKALYGHEVPSFASKDFIKPKIAYRIQEIAFGGLTKHAINMINGINNGRVRVKAPHLEKVRLIPGTNIVKRWKGDVYKVFVTDRGFSIDGMSFSSLSAVAKYITGTNWNGYRFFGIKEKCGE